MPPVNCTMPTVLLFSIPCSHRVAKGCLAHDLVPPAADSSAKYLESHEYAKIEGDIATVGISDHAQVRLSA